MKKLLILSLICILTLNASKRHHPKKKKRFYSLTTHELFLIKQAYEAREKREVPST